MSLLTYSQAASISWAHVLIAEDTAIFSQLMKAKGFSAFGLYDAYLSSFAIDEDEIEIHRRCVIESLKERVGRPWPLAMIICGPDKLYRSTFLDKLMANFDVKKADCPKN